MNLIVASLAATALMQTIPSSPGAHQSTFATPSGGSMLYAISIPRNYDPQTPAPLVLVLHPGGERMRYYGSAFMRGLVAPALSDLQPIMVAPDCPTNSWSDAPAEEAVMALLQNVLSQFNIDRRRVLVTGFSLGGRGTWFMASRHPDLFTAAIPMAASAGDLPIDRLATMPTYIIHSRDDEVSPFAPDERLAKQLKDMGRRARFQALYGLGHYEMYRYVDALKGAGRWVAEEWRKSSRR